MTDAPAVSSGKPHAMAIMVNTARAPPNKIHPTTYEVVGECCRKSAILIVRPARHRGGRRPAAPDLSGSQPALECQSATHQLYHATRSSPAPFVVRRGTRGGRKSPRLNSSH